MTDKLPIKLEKISKKLWPRKVYVKVKESHPILGSLFLTVWSIFWTILAFLLNALLILIIVATILLVFVALFSDSSFDLSFISLNTSSSKKERENER